MKHHSAISPRWISCQVLVLVLALRAVSCSHGAAYFVAPDGNDANSGISIDRPFRTIQRAAAAAVAGDSSFIRAGVYRETVSITESGEKGKPIAFSSYKGERVIIDGADVLTPSWIQAGGNVWRAKVPGKEPIEAVFFDGRMLAEARWPNCAWHENWRPEKKWALTDKGSRLGRIESAALAASGQDLSGGRLYIKLSKGNSCFTRPVAEHQAGAATLLYDATGIEGRAWNEDSMPKRIEKFGFEGNRFFIAARGALDTPGEWWHDVDRGELLLIAPDGGDPGKSVVSVKARVAGFEGEGTSDIVIDDIEFRACNARFENSRRMILRNCRFLYPSTPKVFPDGKTALAMQKNLRLAGKENVVERCCIEWAVDGALEIEGSGNRVENCVVHDCNLHGRHPGPGISARGTRRAANAPAPAPNIIRRCTVYNVGGVGIYALGAGPALVDYNHVFNCGLYCVDISSLYVPTGGKMPGTVVHHNWLHDIHGIGFRVDIQGRDIVFHHNLVWNAAVGCKMQGFQLEGYNNTVVVNNATSGFTVVFEPDLSAAERAGWRVRNNAAYSFLDRLSLRSDYKNAKRPFLLPLTPKKGMIDCNVTIMPGEERRFFVNPAQVDFRPKPGGPLDATGVSVPGIAEGKGGRPPSIGALETNDAPWLAGADWMNDGLPVPSSAKAAAELARQLRPETCVVGSADNRNEEQ